MDNIGCKRLTAIPVARCDKKQQANLNSEVDNQHKFMFLLFLWTSHIMGRYRFEYHLMHCHFTTCRACSFQADPWWKNYPVDWWLTTVVCYFFGQKLVERVYIYKVPQTPHQISQNQKQKRVKRFCAMLRIWVQRPCCHAQSAGARLWHVIWREVCTNITAGDL